MCRGPLGPFKDLEVIRTQAGMSISSFCALFDMPERSWRRWQAKARFSRPPIGPWPQLAGQAARELAVKHPSALPAWGPPESLGDARHDGHRVSQATVLRLLRDEGLILPVHYRRERRQLAERRKAEFAKKPTGANQVWKFDFFDYETTTGGMWRIASCRDYWSKYEFDAHVSPKANMHDAVEAVEKDLAEAELWQGHPLIDDAIVNPEMSEIEPVVTIVTDSGARSARQRARCSSCATPN